MDNRENRAAASFEVRAVDDVTVSVEGCGCLQSS